MGIFNWISKLGMKNSTEESSGSKIFEFIESGNLSALKSHLETLNSDKITFDMQIKSKLQIKNKDGLTPFCLAVKIGNQKILDYLIQQKINLFPPFQYAIQQGNLKIVQYFLKNGVSPNICSTTGYSALHCAVENNHLDIVKELVRTGADMFAIATPKRKPFSAQEYNSPIDLAKKQNNTEILEFFDTCKAKSPTEIKSLTLQEKINRLTPQEAKNIHTKNPQLLMEIAIAGEILYLLKRVPYKEQPIIYKHAKDKMSPQDKEKSEKYIRSCRLQAQKGEKC